MVVESRRTAWRWADSEWPLGSFKKGSLLSPARLLRVSEY